MIDFPNPDPPDSPDSPTDPATYYIAAAGDDEADGLSPASAWAGLTPVNARDLVPGDEILFEGGETFAGSLQLDADDAGTMLEPVRFGSWGSGRATIDAGTSFGLYAYDAAGIEIENLNFTGDGPATNTEAGIHFYTDRSDGARLEYIRVHQVDVTGFRDGGIVIGSWHSSRPGYTDVEITQVGSHNNGDAGVVSWGYWESGSPGTSHQDFYIAEVAAYDNFGDPTNTTSHTGSGIIVSAVDGAVVEFCHAYNNGGTNSNSGGGPVGIWSWEANDVTIQYNLSHDNNTGNGVDGGGFDLDGGVTNSRLQYNYSYNNAGPGYLVAQFQGANPLQGNVIRYNVSQDDGDGGIRLWATNSSGGIDGLDIYHNTIFVSDGSEAGAAAIDFISRNISNVRIANNLFIAFDDHPLVDTVTTSGISFYGNAYWSGMHAFEIDWDGSSHATLSAWRSATSQEVLSMSDVGISADPKIPSAGAGAMLTDVNDLGTLSAYTPASDSPLLDAGIDLNAQFGISPGTRDFSGESVPSGASPDIGAFEFVSP